MPHFGCLISLANPMLRSSTSQKSRSPTLPAVRREPDTLVLRLLPGFSRLRLHSRAIRPLAQAFLPPSWWQINQVASRIRASPPPSRRPPTTACRMRVSSGISSWPSTKFGSPAAMVKGGFFRSMQHPRRNSSKSFPRLLRLESQPRRCSTRKESSATSSRAGSSRPWSQSNFRKAPIRRRSRSRLARLPSSSRPMRRGLLF